MSGGFFVAVASHRIPSQLRLVANLNTTSNRPRAYNLASLLLLSPTQPFISFPMKSILLSLFLASPCFATTISVVPVYEPLSLHGTDVGDIITDIGEALQATVVPRPMALTGAIPEVLVEAIRTPHPIPTNAPNYKVKEANLLVLCDVGISAVMTEEGMTVTLDISKLEIPEEVDMTSRQLIRITFAAIQKTLEVYQKQQTDPLHVDTKITGTTDKNATLKDLEATFIVPPAE